MIWLTGDTHGSAGSISRIEMAARHYFKPGDTLIILGDFSYLWFPHGRNAMQDAHIKWFGEQSFTTLFLDGNHENFDMLDALPTVKGYGGEVGQVNSRLFHLRRGRVYEIEGKKIFTCGGAYSIDKADRTFGLSWWPQELPTTAEMEEILKVAEKTEEVDYVLTHTCPYDIARHILHTKKLDPAMGMPELGLQKMLYEVSHLLKYKHWYFGHWHYSTDFAPKFTCLYGEIIQLGKKADRDED